MSGPPQERSLLVRLFGRPGSAEPQDRMALRRWFLGFVAWLAILTLVAHWSFGQYAAGELSARGAWLVALTLFYLSLCCIFFPAPTVWIVMLLASNEVAVIEPAGPRAVVVALACAIATGVANLNEYHVITFLLRFRRVGRIRETKLYLWAARWFARSPFMVVALFGFLPLPVDVVRWLAIAYRYSRLRYFLAYVVGRFPRYLIWALSAVWLDLDWKQILIFQAALVVGAAAVILRSVLRRRHDLTDAPADLVPVESGA